MTGYVLWIHPADSGSITEAQDAFASIPVDTGFEEHSTNEKEEWKPPTRSRYFIEMKAEEVAARLSHIPIETNGVKDATWEFPLSVAKMGQAT